MPTLDVIASEILQYKNIVLSAIDEIAELDITCKTTLEQYLRDTDSLNPMKIQGIIDYFYENVNIGNYKEVKLYLKKSLTIASYLSLLTYCSNLSNDNLKEALRITDFGIMFGEPINLQPELLQNCATKLHSSYERKDCKIPAAYIKCIRSYMGRVPTNPYNLNVLEVKNCPSLDDFNRDHIIAEKPVVLDNCINHWPALKNWQNPNYFLNIAGLRNIAVEVGKNYSCPDWTQKVMSFGDFIRNHILEERLPKGYLAQYQLFDQVPELKADIAEPEYCSFAESDEPVNKMAWYGPKGTESPMHHDPTRNLLTQVIGMKQVILYAPQDNENVYPHKHELLSNTSQVDPRSPNLDIHPNFAKAKGYYCVLKPGQMLYIPSKWWHHIVSLSVSFSVSFAWR